MACPRGGDGGGGEADAEQLTVPVLVPVEVPLAISRGHASIMGLSSSK